jgi:hypothetical protein
MAVSQETRAGNFNLSQASPRLGCGTLPPSLFFATFFSREKKRATSPQEVAY